MWRRRGLPAVLFMVLTAAVWLGAHPPWRADQAGLGPPALFESLPDGVASAAERPPSADDRVTIRSRLIRLNLTALDSRPALTDAPASARASVVLNLFDDATFLASLDRIDPVEGGYTWVGHIPGIAMSAVTLAVVGDVMSGSVVAPTGAYSIRPAAGGLHEVSQVDQSRFLPELEPIPVDSAAADIARRESTPVAELDPASQIDLMVLYTQGAVAAAGGSSAMVSLVNLGISETNTSYANSGVTQRLRLVHHQQVNHTESGDLAVDLYAVSNADGPTPLGATAATLRDTHKADMVMLVTAPAAPQGCGIAWLMSSVGPSFAPWAFSVVERSCISPNYTFAHELGHNMGARHDWYVDNATTPHTYAHGYVYGANRWRTVMAYNNACSAQGFNCTRLLYWSNPAVTFGSAPMGVAGGTRANCPMGSVAQTNCDADDHRTLNDTALTVANFRQAEAQTAPSVATHPTSITVSAGRTASFTSTATGTPNPTVRWQVSTNGGATWANLNDTVPYSGTTTTTLAIATTPYAWHNHRYRAAFANTAGGMASNPATLSVSPLTPSPASLRFAATKSGPSGILVHTTGEQDVTVDSNGVATAWTVTASQPWLEVFPASGRGSGQFYVRVKDLDNTIGGSTLLTAVVVITPTTAGLSPATVPVTLTVDQSSGAATAPPFGLVDTPVQNAAGVVGTIGITGWALDDVGILYVRVYRNCLAFEPAGNCRRVAGRDVVFVGNATRVTGARPDVEGVYPSHPENTRAAWGYLLLTNLLPHVPTGQMFGGQGTVVLHALATDVQGKETWLGRTLGDATPTTITMANETLNKPFGAIDTPAQGGTTGSILVNFGWTLTPDLDTVADVGDILVPTTGETVRVYIDGAPVGTVSYNQCRGNVSGTMVPGLYCNDDVSNTFGNPSPQPTFTSRTANPTRHRNLDAGRAAIGAFFLDTTTMSNGLHTIMWGVTDSASRSDGIGSRFFTVLNGAYTDAPGQDARGREDRLTALLDAPAQARGDASDLDTFSVSPEPVWGRTGVDPETPFDVVPLDDEGMRALRLPDLGRLELYLGGAVDRGYLVANGALRDLPPGSHLDAAAGLFTWAPGVGYVGPYRLVFVRAGEQVPVTVLVHPRHSAATDAGGIRMHIDTPGAGDDVESVFLVAGWALDTEASVGAGIGAVHVWAQRRDVAGAVPRFLGEATRGGTRPDVAAVHGATGRTSGLGLVTPPLEPGEYDLMVFVWSVRARAWADARTVRITVR